MKKAFFILVLLTAGSLILILIIFKDEESAISSTALFPHENSEMNRSRKYNAEIQTEDNENTKRGESAGTVRLGTALDPSDWAKPSAQTIAIAGKVQYSDGQPVAGAKIECENFRIPEGNPGRTMEIQADGEGKFYLSDIEPGRFVFAACDANDWAFAKNEFREAGKTYNVQICLRAKASLAGEVIDEEFKPIENAEVYLWMGRSNLPKPGWPVPLDMTLRTDKNGHYDFGKIPPNAVKILITRNGYESRNYPYIELTEGKPFRLNTKLKKGSYLAGIVRVNAAYLPDFGSSSHLDQYVSVGLLQREIQKDGEDYFEVANPTELRPAESDGSFRIEITSFLPETWLFVRARGHRPKWIPVDIKRSESKHVEVYLTEKGGIFSGIVKRAEDSQAVKVRIHLRYVPKKDEELEDFDISFEVGQDGSFLVDYLDFAEYSASISFEYSKTPFEKCINHIFTPNAEGLVFKEPIEIK